MAVQTIYNKNLHLILIMTAIATIILGTAIYILYEAAFQEQRYRLIETAQSQARLIEAVARFDQKHSEQDAFQDTLGQIREAHRNFPGFGKTGEFVLAMLEDDNIIFLLSHRHHDLPSTGSAPFYGKEAEPMQLALQGKSGTLIGLDYRGERVLAAYEPVAELNLGVVAKIDLKEIRAPFITAAGVSSGTALLLILIGAWLFQLITRIMASHIEESEKLFSDTFTHAAIGLAHVTPNGTWLRVNQALCSILGYTSEELLQSTFQDITHPDDLNVDLHYMEQVLAGELDTHSLEKRYIRKDGSIVPTILTYSLVRNRAGEPDYFISAVKDISEQVQLRDMLKDKSERLEIAIDGTSDGLWFWDIDTDYEWHAPHWKKLLGYDVDEPLPEKYSTWESRVHPDDKDEVLNTLKHHLEENTPYDCEHRLRTKTGEYRWFRDRGIALRDDSGNPTRMGGSIQDISDLKTAENRLKESHKEISRAKDFIDNALDAQKDTFFLFDPSSGRAIRWNKAFRDISGYSDEEIAELPAPLSYYSSQDLELAANSTQAILDGNSITTRMELICKDGRKVPTEYQASLIKDEKGERNYVVSIGRDVSEHEKLEAQLRQSQKMEAIGTLVVVLLMSSIIHLPV